MWMNQKVMGIRPKRIDGALPAILFGACLLMGQVPAVAQSGTAEKKVEKKTQEKESPADAKGVPQGDVASRGAPKPGDRLHGIDTSKINLSGADLDYEVVGDQLILKGNEDDLNLVESLISALETSVEQTELRVVTVAKKDAHDIASTIQPALRQVLFEPNIRPESEVTVTALSGNILLVSALPRHIEFVVDVIKQVDEVEDTIGKFEQLIFEVKHRKAADVAEELKDIVAKMREKKGEQGPKGEIQIVPNNANNTIMVIVAQSERATIQKLINQLDVEPVKGWGEVKLTLFPLLHSKANELANVINDLLNTQPDREAAEEVIQRLRISKALPSGEIIDLSPIDLNKSMRIIPDEGTNSLIVATVEENILPMGELIRLMDGVPTGEEVRVKLFPLRFADAQTVSETLTEMFDKGKDLPEDPDGSGSDAVAAGETGKALAYNVGIAADARTNTLIVSGRQEQIDLAVTVVAELDRPATGLKFPLRLIPLAYADATRLGQVITELFDARFEAVQSANAGQAAVERERVFLSVDIRTNSLLISASEENAREIETIARQLDSRPAKLFEQIRLVTCHRLSASDLKAKIDELWQRKASLRQNEQLLEDLPIVVVDDRSNALIVASSVEDYEEIAQLVNTLEAEPMNDNTELFKLEFADASVLKEMLDSLFEGITSGSDSLSAPTILAAPRSNALVVAGTPDMLDRTKNLISRLDMKAGPNSAVIRVYALQYGSGVKLAPRLQELFDSRSEGRDVAGTPIVLFADEGSNSLVCSASRDDQDVVAELVHVLDRPSSMARQFEIFPLKMAKAATVADKMETLFQSQAEGGAGRADTIAAEADERTNSIIVWGSPSEMENIAQVIAKLDTSTPAVEMKVKVIQLKHALAEDFATLLQDTVLGDNNGTDDERALILNFDQMLEDGSTVTRKLLRQDIQIQPDPRTNSLLIMAPKDSMAMLDAMIQDFDKVHPIRSELRLFPLVNSDAQAMVDRLTELFNPDTGNGEAESQLMFGDENLLDGVGIANVGQNLRFTADPRTNTLIAAGAEVDLRMVERLVYHLDAQEAEPRVVNVYNAKFRDAQDIATAVQNFNQQEQDALGQVADQESQRQRIERQISVESVGQADQGSSSLIVGTGRSSFARTMDMINQLDRPEPQVRISVVVGELTMSDSMELGMEIAGQDLNFSDSAVVGPNGVIQGGDFDVVLGTDVGAAPLGLGGFNFTLTGEDFSFLFHALQQQSKLEVLSRPTLVVRNGEEGSITIADEVPIVESSRLNDTGQTQSAIGREDVGIVLTATPHISPDGYVTIELDQQVSQIGDNIQLTEGVSSPIFTTREVVTNVTVRDGETVVIGGLIQSRKSNGENKVPILGDLPWIGVLFRARTSSTQRTELLAVLTVEILHAQQDMHDMSIRERDRYDLAPTVGKSPLMEGLRILPEDGELGPTGYPSGEPSPAKRQEPEPSPQPKYGPLPRTYGPIISKPKSITTTTTAAVYGPHIVRGETDRLE